MTSNRQAGFARRVMQNINGIASVVVKNGMQQIDDGVAFELRKKAANKADRIEIKPDINGTVGVRFLKGSECPWIEISRHSAITMEKLPELIFNEAGILTGAEAKEEGVGLFRTTKW